MNNKEKKISVFEAYLSSLEESGKKIPTNQHGDPNLSAIATACGWGKYGAQNFRHSSELKSTLDKAVAELGIEHAHSRQDALESRLDSKDRRIKQLEEQLEAKRSETLLLRRKVKELEEKVDLQSLANQMILGNGKRIFMG
ncbi:MAG: hypothetical protein ABIL62_06955 [Planctomycetota bacterium]